MESVWNRYGIRMESERHMSGIGKEYVWNGDGIRMKYVWTMHGIGVV